MRQNASFNKGLHFRYTCFQCCCAFLCQYGTELTLNNETSRGLWSQEEELFTIFMELGSTGNYFWGAGEQAGTFED